MAKTVVIVGAGIIGACAAFRMAQAGAQVLLVDAGDGAATAASFGWINGSYFLTEDHFRLRVAGMAAWAKLASELDLPIKTSGCISWEFSGAELQEQKDALERLGYPVEVLSRAEVAAREPNVSDIPEQSLFFPSEAVAEPEALASAMIAAAQALGARVVAGVRVTGFSGQGDEVQGVQTTAGTFEADEVLIAAGTGSERLLAGLDISLPMVPRPAYVLETCPVAPALSYVLATPFGEVRQRPDGAIVMPCAVAHQSDAREHLDRGPLDAGEEALTRLQRLLPDVELAVGRISLAWRPMPADGLPVVGRVRPGLSVATMHSGLTLGAIMGEVLAREVLSGPDNETAALLASFRPDRFAQK